MADTLLFRGGSSASITASTVQSRELVIDTDTDQIVSGASKKKTVMEDSSGNISIDGSAAFSGNLAVTKSGGMVSIDGPGGNNLIQCSTGNRATALGMWAGGDTRWYSTGGMTFSINATANDGGAPSGHSDAAAIDSSGNFLIGGTLPSSPNIELNSDGSAQFESTVSSESFFESDRNFSTGACFVGKNSGSQTSKISADGSAAFAGTNRAVTYVQTANLTGAPSAGNAGTMLQGGTVFATRGSNINIWEGRAEGSTTVTSSIKPDGSAEFAGDVTCTDNSKGLVLKSPDGTSFRLSVANDGTLSATSI